MIKMMKYGEVPSSEIFARGTAETDVSDIVADILAEVRQKGDAALLAYAKQFDKADLQALEVSEAEIDVAFQKVEPAFIAVRQRISAPFTGDRSETALSSPATALRPDRKSRRSRRSVSMCRAAPQLTRLRC